MADQRYFSDFTGPQIDNALGLALENLPFDPASFRKAVSVALPASGWSGKAQTVTVLDVLASSIVVVSPDPGSFEAYAAAVVRCTGQADSSLTFNCTTAPTAALTVNVLIF